MIRRCFFAALAVVMMGCNVQDIGPDLASLYGSATRQMDISRRAVILIPGTFGSRLRDSATGQVIWGAFGGENIDPRTEDGARELALPMRIGAPLRDLHDNAVPDGVLDKVTVDLFAIPVEIQAYADLMATLGTAGYRDEDQIDANVPNYGDDHYSCFQFDYDWRRDVVENAQRLHVFIQEKRSHMQQESLERFGVADADIQFDLVAHSQGCLVARYFLRYGDADLPDDGSLPALTWSGAQFVHRAILVGPPNAGTIVAFERLVEDTVFGPQLPVLQPALAGTFPSAYEQLPRSRHLRIVLDNEKSQPVGDIYDVEVWKRMHWGLADPEQDATLSILMPDVTSAADRRRIALDHLDKCLNRARRLQAALDESAAPPAGLSISLFAGDAVLTPSVARIDPATGCLASIELAAGDGTITRASALMDERVGGTSTARLSSPITWSSVQFLSTDHFGMTRDPAFGDNVLFQLLEMP